MLRLKATSPLPPLVPALNGRAALGPNRAIGFDAVLLHRAVPSRPLYEQFGGAALWPAAAALTTLPARASGSRRTAFLLFFLPNVNYLTHLDPFHGLF
jgi:hypothetical protein